MARKFPKARAAVQSPKKTNNRAERSRHLSLNLDSSPAKARDVASITESLAQLNLSIDGPISRLPNELVHSILARFEMQELIPMQTVCKRWLAVIHSIGHTKKCLFLTDVLVGPFDDASLKERSFGLIDLNNTFTSLKLRSSLRLAKDLAQPSYAQLGKLFTSVEQLVVHLPWPDIITILHCLPSSQLTTLSITPPKAFQYNYNSEAVTRLFTRINSFTALKRLDIYSQFDFFPRLAPTFARLEQFSSRRYYEFITRDVDVQTHISHFGPNCARIGLHNYIVSAEIHWHTLNAQWLANVTHLELNHVKIKLVIHNITKYAVSLQVLRLGNYSIGASFDSQLIGHLSKLTNLTEFGLSTINFHLDHLTEAARTYELIPLTTIRICTFSRLNRNYDAERFTSVLSAIFPNVEHLNLNAYYKPEPIDQYLARFTKLKTHSFSVINI